MRTTSVIQHIPSSLSFCASVLFPQLSFLSSRSSRCSKRPAFSRFWPGLPSRMFPQNRRGWHFWHQYRRGRRAGLLKQTGRSVSKPSDLHRLVFLEGLYLLGILSLFQLVRAICFIRSGKRLQRGHSAPGHRGRARQATESQKETQEKVQIPLGIGAILLALQDSTQSEHISPRPEHGLQRRHHKRLPDDGGTAQTLRDPHETYSSSQCVHGPRRSFRSPEAHLCPQEANSELQRGEWGRSADRRQGGRVRGWQRGWEARSGVQQPAAEREKVSPAHKDVQTAVLLCSHQEEKCKPRSRTHACRRAGTANSLQEIWCFFFREIFKTSNLIFLYCDRSQIAKKWRTVQQI